MNLLAIVEPPLRRDVHCPARLEAALDGRKLLRPPAVAAVVVVAAVAAAAATCTHHTGGGAGAVAEAVPRPPVPCAAATPTLLAGLRRGRVQGARVKAGDGGLHQVLVGHVRRLLVQLLLELLLLGGLLLQVPGIEKHDPSHDHSHSLTQSCGDILCHGEPNSLLAV